MKYFENFTAE